MTQYIADVANFKEVIARVPKVKRSLWIGTADIKDLYVEERPFLGLLADLIKKGKEVRLIHAKEPGPNFREDFDHYPVLFTGLDRALCPRVHFKIIIFDLQTAYIGSANLTGAGIGMKSHGGGRSTLEMLVKDVCCRSRRWGLLFFAVFFLKHVQKRTQIIMPVA